jgi:hypothetical protein
MCRYCHGEETKEALIDKTLISPCVCDGTFRYVHKQCLMSWLFVSNKPLQCEICQTDYTFIETVLYKRDKHHLWIAVSLLLFLMCMFHLCLYVLIGSILSLDSSFNSLFNRPDKTWNDILLNGFSLVHIVIGFCFIVKLCINEAEHQTTLKWFRTLFGKQVTQLEDMIEYFIFFITCPFACLLYASIVQLINKANKEEQIVLIDITNHPERLPSQYV